MRAADSSIRQVCINTKREAVSKLLKVISLDALFTFNTVYKLTPQRLINLGLSILTNKDIEEALNECNWEFTSVAVKELNIRRTYIVDIYVGRED